MPHNYVAAAPGTWNGHASFHLVLALTFGPWGYLHHKGRCTTATAYSWSDSLRVGESIFDELNVRIYANSSEQMTSWEWRQEEELPLAIRRNNSNLFVLAECVGRHPTEWVFGGEVTDGKPGGCQNGRSRSEYSSRGWDGRTLFKAIIKLSYRPRLKEKETLICRSVDHGIGHACIRVTLTPLNRLRSNSVRITQELCGSDYALLDRDRDHVEMTSTEASSESESPGCKVEFLVYRFGREYGVYCNFTELPPEERFDPWAKNLEFHTCETAAYCANTMRNARIPTNCVRMVGGANSRDLSSVVWRTLDEDVAGLAICTPHNSRGRAGAGAERMAIEYFLGNPTHPDQRDQEPQSERTLHFVQTGLSLSELVWMELKPTRSYYYTEEVITIRCFAPLYGFAGHPEFTVTFTPIGGRGREVRLRHGHDHRNAYPDMHVKTLMLPLNKRGAGTYQIQCSNPVWNTNELVNCSQDVQVREAVPLKFDDPVKHVVFAEGLMGAQLWCDAYGDPMPVSENVTWIWDASRYPGHAWNSIVLNLPVIAGSYDGTVITCTASNMLGHNVTKSFYVSVTQPMTTGTMVAIVVVLICIGLLIWLGWMYFEYWAYRGVALPSSEDVREFRNGKPPTPSESPGLTVALPKMAAAAQDYVSCTTQEPLDIQSLPYNLEWEMPRRKIHIDWNTILGSGEFSVVYKGSVKGVAVGVKMVKREQPLEYFKALMSELKIHAYVGHHKNIVNLVAANSSRIQKRELYLCVELCSGSLLAYLQAQESGPAGVNLLEFTLVRWATEIAAGMEFIASKRIVHGDLAARNVLLTFDPVPTAKVGDFGLARLTDYIYTQKNGTPRPWAWMAIECFTERRFSTKSDVWAFGVTLWEMWALGMAPYAGMQFGNEFCTELGRGMRLGQPVVMAGWTSNKMYEIMTLCWACLPRNRPTFTELRQKIQRT